MLYIFSKNFLIHTSYIQDVQLHVYEGIPEFMIFFFLQIEDRYHVFKKGLPKFSRKFFF